VTGNTGFGFGQSKYTSSVHLSSMAKLLFGAASGTVKISNDEIIDKGKQMKMNLPNMMIHYSHPLRGNKECKGCPHKNISDQLTNI
jgi:hypothetical protein